MTAVVADGLSWPSESFSWLSVPGRVERWAREVSGDLHTPDLWAELRRKHAIATGAGYDDVANTPFGPDEQTEILEQVHEIKELVNRTDSVSEARRLFLEAKLDETAYAVGRVGRRDWQLMFGGVVSRCDSAAVPAPRGCVRHLRDMGNTSSAVIGCRSSQP